MGEVLVGIPDAAAGAGVAEVRTRDRGSGKLEQYVIPIDERVPSFKGMCASFRTLGAAAVAQNLFSIENTAGSAIIVAVKRISLQMDATAVLVAVAKTVFASRPASLPSAGTTLSKVNRGDSAQSSAANVICRGATASDGGGATAITATVAARGWSQMVMRMHTLVGQVLMDDESQIPALCAEDPIYLKAGESLLIAITAAATTSNPATDHHVINCAWEEFTLP